MGAVMSELSMRVGGMDVLEGMGWIAAVSAWRMRKGGVEGRRSGSVGWGWGVEWCASEVQLWW